MGWPDQSMANINARTVSSAEEVAERQEQVRDTAPTRTPQEAFPLEGLESLDEPKRIVVGSGANLSPNYS